MTQFPPDVHALIEASIAEDQTFNDPTTQAVVSPETQATGTIRAKANGVLAGVDLAIEVFHRVEPTLDAQAILQDGSQLSPGDDIAVVRGSAAGILKAERIALNFMQRMSGIASDTNRYVQAVQGLKARIVDTRKTAPGHRYLDKYSVRMGGGHNHRLNLADGILIKDNHIQANRSREMGLKQVIELALANASHTIRVEVEVETMEQVKEALEAGAHIIMLDNMTVPEMADAMQVIGDQAIVEASGGITYDTVRAVAETGVDLISIGALTHSVTALDISLDLDFD
ncbi:MAG: carboxylating nicotinate-nucleotide diphosphorylase [SAR202 cluster bacterium]|nr:nicotinate-nucleotide diphosphorylase (carboxylating) [Chloroflexota bacterium]MQG33101.1 carboxylating nicotinate-nucleotide diphosphorylase [SAR202 cluster bacterium]HCP24297.1 carboxylating nicotinate-nucleotide diphosphorylase [Dehalococcoidia bacterium]|tara:strand:- start:287 stop:1141 length:855 start_codon:yes stop_codon:yes gene_type:complete